MKPPRRTVRGIWTLTVLALLGAGTTWDAGAAPKPASAGTTSATAGLVGRDSEDGPDEVLGTMDAYNSPRLAPSGVVLPGAYGAAWSHVLGMPVRGSTFSEVTTRPTNGDALHYRSQGSSNSGGGDGYVSGRIAALAVDPSHAGVVYAGAAGGGVFRSSDDGATWTPIADHMPALAVGALTVMPDGSLWLATGEATTSADQYVGSGVYRLADPTTGTFTAADRVGGTELESTSIHELRLDSANGNVFAVTSRGVFRRGLNAAQTTPWQRILAPCAGIGITGVSCGTNAYYADIANDIAVQPNSGGQRLVANLAFSRGGAGYNGFYFSSDGGATWTMANPLGAINPHEIGNATFAYSADGSRLYVVMESPSLYSAKNTNTTLAGVFVSASGDVNGPYTQIASSGQLASSGSALALPAMGKNYQPGINSWYNQALAVDPANPDHLYLALEEVYETWNGGTTWNTIGRYWNFGLSCFSYVVSQNTCDGNVMHSDQHALAIASWTGHAPEVFVGNDGGAWARPVAQTAPGWRDLNKSGTLRALQYYSVGVGSLPGGGGDVVWGGLQDNGVILSAPKGSTYTYTYPGTSTPVTEQLNPTDEMAEPFGGDGGDQLVNPHNGCQTVGEYTYLAMQVTDNCGYTANDDATPNAILDISPGDPNARFIAPFAADSADPNYWVAGGEFVWGNSKTWASTAGTDWQQLADSGAGHSVTAVASMKTAAGGHVIWAGWCGSCNPGGTFGRGVLTNLGGTWHQQALPAAFPDRYIQGVTIDPADPTGASVYVLFSGFSRHWNEGPGAGYGHVWHTTDGGMTWSDVSGVDTAADSFPDAPANRLIIAPDGTLTVATDLGVFTDDVKADGLGHWKRLGLTDPQATGNLPTSPAVYLVASPDAKQVYVATHGRGIWATTMP